MTQGHKQFRESIPPGWPAGWLVGWLAGSQPTGRAAGRPASWLARMTMCYICPAEKKVKSVLRITLRNSNVLFIFFGGQAGQPASQPAG